MMPGCHYRLFLITLIVNIVEVRMKYCLVSQVVSLNLLFSFR